MYVCKMLNIEMKFNQTLAFFCFTIVVVVFDIFFPFPERFFFSSSRTHTRTHAQINLFDTIFAHGLHFLAKFSVSIFRVRTIYLLSLWLKMFHRYAKSHQNALKNKNFGCILCVFSFYFLAVVSSLILHDSDDDDDDKETNYFRNGYKEFVCIILIHWFSISVCLLAEKLHRICCFCYFFQSQFNDSIYLDENTTMKFSHHRVQTKKKNRKESKKETN